MFWTVVPQMQVQRKIRNLMASLAYRRSDVGSTEKGFRHLKYKIISFSGFPPFLCNQYPGVLKLCDTMTPGSSAQIYVAPISPS
jgi:hypothetical protein